MLFSVIVPIYNIEKYIKRCIDSVLGQTFTDFELILVDDGSPDKCPEICEEYARADARIKVIHKPNGGLVSARQAGIRVAEGEYIFNLDGDDAVAPDALEQAHQIISQTRADMVCFSHRTWTDGVVGDVVYELLDEGLYGRAELERQIFPNLLLNKDMQHVLCFLWGKAIRRDLAIKHQLNVSPSICLGEDLCCVIPCYLECESVYVSKADVYFYTVRTDSLSTNFKTQQITQIAEVVKMLHGLEMKTPVDFEQQIARYSCFMCFAILAAAAEGKHFDVIDTLGRLILNSVHKQEIANAHFGAITPKSRIGIFFMKRHKFQLAFYFLYLCKRIKDLKGKGEPA